MSFFQFNEQSLRDAINRQKQQEEKKEKKHDAEYDGHKLTFLNCSDGAVAIESDPPLVKAVSGPESKDPHPGTVDFWTMPYGWVKRE